MKVDEKDLAMAQAIVRQLNRWHFPENKSFKAADTMAGVLMQIKEMTSYWISAVPGKEKKAGLPSAN